MILRVVCLGAVLGALGCSGKHSDAGNTSVTTTDSDGGTAPRHVCVDMDGDGFGTNCSAGKDCDDTDPTVTDECVRCATENLGCPCEPGTAPLRCDPHYAKKTTQNGKTGTIMCSEGTRYCRDAFWSDCEVLLQYATFVPDK